MIDGINILHNAPNRTHLKDWDIWETLVNAKTLQRVTDKCTTNFRGLDMALKERQSKDGFRFEVKGSLHKYHNAGRHNADQFNFEKLVQSISSFTDITGISANDYSLHGLEIGINIPLTFAPSILLKNIVSYGNKGFDLIDKKSVKTGLQCALSQYTLKVYDKGRQSKTDGNILRFEVAINKMAVLEKYGLHTLSDLQNPEKVQPLVNVLLDTAKRIIWTDRATDLNQLTDREQKQWLRYSNPKSWEDMTINARKHHARKWQIIFEKYATKYDLESMIKNTWHGLFEAQNTPHFYRPEKNNKAQKHTPFLPLEYTVKTGCRPTQKIHPNNININNNIKSAKITKNDQPPEPQFCASCGKSISHQRKNSRFCSLRFVGKLQAKKCRNKDSNIRNHKKEKIIKAMEHKNFVQITYTTKDGTAYTDTLHPTELQITRKWLDRILSVKILPTARNEPPETLEAAKAKDYIKSLINSQT